MTRSRKAGAAEFSQREVAYSAPLVFLLPSLVDRIPPFSIFAAEMMERDPQVGFAAKISNGPLYHAQIVVDADSPEVGEFVAAQWSKLWTNHAAAIMRAKQFGYAAFQACYALGASGLWEFDKLNDFHPRDVRCLTVGGQKVGLRVKAGLRDQANQTPDLWGAAAAWFVFNREYGGWYGRPLFERAYPVWWEKRSRGGAVDLRRLRMQKDAWIGDVVRFPPGVSTDSNGTKVSNRDFAFQLIELRSSGGGVAIPNERDAQGNPKWDYQPASGSTSGPAPVLEYCAGLDTDIFRAFEIPSEVVEAAQTGSGFSGRTIPFIAFLTGADQQFAEHVADGNRDILQPLVGVNFPGHENRYQIKPRPLLETIGEQMGAMGQPNAQSQAPGADSGAPGHEPALSSGRPPLRLQAGYQFAQGDDSAIPSADALNAQAAKQAAEFGKRVRRMVGAALKKNAAPRRS